jgi:hypothetical protein
LNRFHVNPFRKRGGVVAAADIGGVLLVARMAGTSVTMVERVHGNFRNQSYQDAHARLDREWAARGL